MQNVSLWDHRLCVLLPSIPGYILMSLKLPAERLKAASILATTIVDCENIHSDLIPYIAMESQANREAILKCITTAQLK